MQLQEIEPLDGEVFQAAVDESAEVLCRVPRADVRVEPAARLGGDMERLGPLPPQLGNEPL